MRGFLKTITILLLTTGITGCFGGRGPTGSRPNSQSSSSSTYQKEYKVSFDTGTPLTIESQYVPNGEKAQKPDDPFAHFCCFEGWITENGKIFDFNTPITKDTYLSANYADASFSYVDSVSLSEVAQYNSYSNTYFSNVLAHVNSYCSPVFRFGFDFYQVTLLDEYGANSLDVLLSMDLVCYIEGDYGTKAATFNEESPENAYGSLLGRDMLIEGMWVRNEDGMDEFFAQIIDVSDPIDTFFVFDQEEYQVPVNGFAKTTLNASFNLNDYEITYIIENTGIASVSSNGIVTGLSEGNTVLYAYCYALGLGTSCVINVYHTTPEPDPIKGTISDILSLPSNVSNQKYLLDLTIISWGHNGTLSAANSKGTMMVSDSTGEICAYYVYASENYVTWDPSTASYTRTGSFDFLTNELTKNLKIGNTIHCEAVRMDYKTTPELTMRVLSYEQEELESISFSGPKLLALGRSMTFNPTLTPLGANPVLNWDSKDPDIASVDQNGVVTANKVGETKIYARYNDISAYFVVTVVDEDNYTIINKSSFVFDNISTAGYNTTPIKKEVSGFEMEYQGLYFVSSTVRMKASASKITLTSDSIKNIVQIDVLYTSEAHINLDIKGAESVSGLSSMNTYERVSSLSFKEDDKIHAFELINQLATYTEFNEIRVYFGSSDILSKKDIPAITFGGDLDTNNKVFIRDESWSFEYSVNVPVETSYVFINDGTGETSSEKPTASGIYTLFVKTIENEQYYSAYKSIHFRIKAN